MLVLNYISNYIIPIIDWWVWVENEYIMYLEETTLYVENR